MLKYQDRILYGADGGVRAGQAASALIQMQAMAISWIWLEQSYLSGPSSQGIALTSFCPGQNLPRECEATFPTAGRSEILLRAPIVSALMEVGSRPWTLPGWSAASLGFGVR